MWKRSLYIFLLTILAKSAFAESVIATLGSDNARFFYSTEMWGQQAGPVELETGLFFNEDNSYLLNVGMMLRNDTMDSPFVFSIGGRGYFATVNEKDTNQEYKVASLALGAELLYVPDNLGGIGLGVAYYYAPDILSGGDSQGLSELGLMIDYQLTPQANIFAGYRKIDIDIKVVDREVELTSGFYFGLGIRY